MNPALLQLNRRILVIDDNAAIHADFSKILGAHASDSYNLARTETELFGRTTAAEQDRPSFELASATQGLEGLDAARKAVQAGRPFALAFVDVRMPPGMDGIETTARLWQIDPDLQVVICTAFSDYSWVEMCQKLGHSERLVILKKPFDTLEVLQLACALTEKWRLLQSTKQRLEELQKLVAERTHYLQAANAQLEAEVNRRIQREECLSLQNEVTRVLTDSTAPAEELVRSLLQVICARMNWDLGRLWLVDRPARLLRCSVALNMHESALPGAEADTTLMPGCGLAGEIWVSGEPTWMEPVDPAGNGLPWHAGLGFPLRLEGEIIGVLEFRSVEARPRQPALLEALASIGGVIGQAFERKRLADQLRHAQKLEAIGHLAGGIAHDFNNILTVIQGYAQVLKSKPSLESETSEGLNQIALAADRAASLTRQLLAFSRKQIIQARPLDLNEVVAHIQKMLRRMIGEDIMLHFEPAAEPAIVWGDEGMLTQVLMNLACNARDAMSKGGQLTLNLSLVSLDEGLARKSAEARTGEFVCLRVRDTGCGIPPEDLSRIFEPFFTTKEVGRGTGLGLCTVYGIVKQHQGWIEVASRPGAGSTFCIYLPRVAQPLSPPDVEPTNLKNLNGRETILLVEDETAVRLLAREFLTRLGYSVLDAKSGPDALAVWEAQGAKVDLLLTDIIMPGGLNGRELARRLHQSHPGLTVLYVSGYHQEPEQEREDLIEGENYLQKPYSLPNLAKTIRQNLDRHGTRPQSRATVCASR